MNDLLMAWRNIWRNPRRSVLTILAIVFATALLVFMLSFQFGAYDDMIDSSVRLSTGHVQIVAPGYHERPEMRKVISDPDRLIQASPHFGKVEKVAKRSEAFVLASGDKRSRGLAVTGVDPAIEREISSVPHQIVEGRYLKEGDGSVAVIGSLAARHLQLGIGDEIVMLGSGRDGSIAAGMVTIIGIFKSGIDEFDRAAMQLPMVEFDSIFSMDGAVHRLIYTFDQLTDSTPTADRMRADGATSGLQVMTWEELTPGLKQSIELDLISGIIMYFILVVVVAFSIVNTFFMAIFERKKEFGVLMSIGMKPGRLVRLMLLESLSMTWVGLVLGIMSGIAITLLVSRYGISMGDSAEFMAQYGMPERLYPKLTLLSIVVGPLLIFTVTMLTALRPVLRIPTLKPVEALRS
jgi:ABC-type lipoprotein release transport system permease subunit